MTPLRTSVAATLAGLVLAACGGGTNPEAMQVSELPLAVTLSSAEFSRYAAGLPPSDSAEPIDVSRLTPPTSDTDEPEPAATAAPEPAR